MKEKKRLRKKAENGKNDIYLSLISNPLICTKQISMRDFLPRREREEVKTIKGRS